MVKARKSTALSKVNTLEKALKQSNVIDCKMLFDAIRQHKDEYWKSAMILNLSIPFANKIKTADSVIASEKAYDWFLEKLNNLKKLIIDNQLIILRLAIF